MREIAKSLGAGAIALFAIVAIVVIAALLIRNGVWLGALLYPWLLALNGITFAITVFLLLPNAIFSSTPRFAGSGMMIASYVFGLTLWVWSLLLTYALWGGLGLLVGLFMAGVGVVPLAMLATLVNAMWSELGQLLLLLVITCGVRVWGYELIAKAARNA
jgi:hypothetical protein